MQAAIAAALARASGDQPLAEEALAPIAPLENDSKLLELLAVRGHLLLELGRRAEAAAAFRASLECPCSEPERRFCSGN